MITFSNGHKVDYMVASGAIGFDGKGIILLDASDRCVEESQEE